MKLLLSLTVVLGLSLQSIPCLAQPPGEPVFLVSADSTQYVARPDISMAPDGRFVVVYGAIEVLGGSAFARLYDSQGVPRGLPFELTGGVTTPNVATDSTGAFVVIWNSGHDAHQQRYDPDGNPVPTDPPIVNQVTPHFRQRVDGNPDVAMSVAGMYSVVWDSNGDAGDGAGVYARVLDPDGIPVTPVLQVNITPRWIDFPTAPSVAMDDNGNFVVAWHNMVNLDRAVFARKFDASGTPLSTEFRVDTAPNPHQELPATAMSGDGRFMIIWRNNYATGNSEGVFGRVFDAACSPVGQSFALHALVDSMVYFEPRLDCDGLGSFTALWTRRRIDGDPFSAELFFRQFDSDGTPLWPETNQPATALASVTGVASGGDGTFVIVWPAETSPRRLFGRRFPAPPVPVAFRAADIRAYTDRIEITWGVFADDDLAGFRVYRRQLTDTPQRLLTPQILGPERCGFVDRDVLPGEKYAYVVTAVTTRGDEYPAPQMTASVPIGSATLEQNVPNPFNPRTTIAIYLPKKDVVTLSVFDVRGRLVSVLASGLFPPGRHEWEWDGRNQLGMRVSSGVYFYRLIAGKSALTRRMVLVK